MFFYRIVLSLILCFAALSAQISGDVPADTYAPDTFPIIRQSCKARDCVRVVSFNVRCTDVNGVPQKERADVVRKTICDLAPDSAGLQEVTEAWVKDLKKIPGCAMVGEAREGGGRGEGCYILYNSLKWKCLDSGTFWLSETPDTPSLGWDAACKRVCTWAKLRNRLTGETYVHVNSHFDHKGRVAVTEEAKMVSAFIGENFGDLPVVFTADLNAKPDSESYRIMTESLADARLCAADKQEYGTFHGTHPETMADYYIDYVLTGPGAEAAVYRTVTVGVNGRFVSDHFPIYADVRFGRN